MSRGRGPVQQTILNVLARHDWVDMPELVVHTYHPDRFDAAGNCDDWSYSHAEFAATHRAVRALEVRRLVKTEVEPAVGDGPVATIDGIRRIHRVCLAR